MEITDVFLDVLDGNDFLCPIGVGDAWHVIETIGRIADRRDDCYQDDNSKNSYTDTECMLSDECTSRDFQFGQITIAFHLLPQLIDHLRTRERDMEGR